LCAAGNNKRAQSNLSHLKAAAAAAAYHQATAGEATRATPTVASRYSAAPISTPISRRRR